MPTILLLSTCDTKLPETLYLHSLLTAHHSTTPLLLDLSRTPTTHPSITHPSPDYTHLPRSEYIIQATKTAIPLVHDLYTSHKIHGVLGIGGSCGTALATGVMRDALPIGFPKVMVSTMASGDVSSFIGESDITMMYSVVDIAGRNGILERVLGNAVGMVFGAARYYFDSTAAAAAAAAEAGAVAGRERKVRIGITMFGVTTPCVTRMQEYLSQNHGYEVYVFHATGSGGRAMERLIREHQLDAVVDMTTTEIADEIGGGVLSAGSGRLDAAVKARIPALVSVGACDMLNFGPVETLPDSFKERLLYRHNPSVTLVRTTEDECRRIGEFIASKLKGAPDSTKVILPTGGISMIDVPGMPFHDPQADEVLFSTVEKELEGRVPVLRDQRDINDPEFAVSAAESIVDLIQTAL